MRLTRENIFGELCALRLIKTWHLFYDEINISLGKRSCSSDVDETTALAAGVEKYERTRRGKVNGGGGIIELKAGRMISVKPHTYDSPDAPSTCSSRLMCCQGSAVNMYLTK